MAICYFVNSCCGNYSRNETILRKYRKFKSVRPICFFCLTVFVNVIFDELRFFILFQVLHFLSGRIVRIEAEYNINRNQALSQLTFNGSYLSLSRVAGSTPSKASY